MTLHLFIKDRIPPHIQHSSRKLTPPYEKTAQIESTAILGNENVHWSQCINVCDLGYVQGIVRCGDISNCKFVQTRENLIVEAPRGFHDVSVL
jgi:hypothetical protein